jgi:proline iminopeptidase
VIAMILRGVFLCRRADLLWFYQDGASRVFPDNWTHFVEHIPPEERGDFMGAYYRRLTGPNEIARMSAAKAWSLWEAQCATLRPNHELIDHFSDPHVALALARIEAHYFVNDAFLAENQLLRDAHRIAGIPGFIIHGRYDMVCPVDNAFALHAAWPLAELQVIRDAGHSAAEPGITDALVRATREVAGRVRAG